MTETTARLDYDKADIYILCRNGYERNRLDSCKKEPDTVAWIEAMPEDAVLWDVGANVGTYTLIAAMNGHNVHAFEPQHESRAALFENYEKNKPYPDDVRIEVCPFALSSKSSRGELKGAQESGAGKVSLILGSGDTLVERMDVISWGWAPPDYIKIDVEGHEVEVLKGGKETLRKVKSILVEVTDDTEPEVRRLAEEAGLKEVSRRVRNARDGTTNVIYAREKKGSLFKRNAFVMMTNDPAR